MPETGAIQRLYSGRIPLALRLQAPMHHGAGTSGNTQLLRTETFVQDDGALATVPFVSSNSLRHQIRKAAADHLLAVTGAEFAVLSKAVADLLYSGGALTGSGANIDLATHRELESLWPLAGLMGYAGSANIWGGTLYVDNVHLVCAENVWRMPEHLRSHPHAQIPAAAFMDEEFGTRHDIAGTPSDRWSDLALWTDKSSQMIYDWQVVRAGSWMYTELRVDAATEGHLRALWAAWRQATALGGIHLGAKRAQGHGLAQPTFQAAIAASPYAGVPEPAAQITMGDPDFDAALLANRDRILDLLARAA